MYDFWNRPCASVGLISYRYVQEFGYVMIGANDDLDAIKQASRSLCSGPALPKNLEVWDGSKYVTVDW